MTDRLNYIPIVVRVAVPLESYCDWFEMMEVRTPDSRTFRMPLDYIGLHENSNWLRQCGNALLTTIPSTLISRTYCKLLAMNFKCNMTDLSNPLIGYSLIARGFLDRPSSIPEYLSFCA